MFREVPVRYFYQQEEVGRRQTGGLPNQGFGKVRIAAHGTAKSLVLQGQTLPTNSCGDHFTREIAGFDALSPDSKRGCFSKP